MKNQICNFPLFPIVITISLVFSQFFSNYTETTFRYVLSGLFIAVVIVGIFWLIVQRIFRNPQKTSLFMFCLSMLMFSFQSIVRIFWLLTSIFVDEYVALRFWMGINGQLVSFLFVFFLMVLIALLLKTIKLGKYRFNLYLNILSLALLLLIGINGLGIITKNSTDSFQNYWQTQLENDHNYSKISTKNTPDIYYIVLDGFTRNDILREYYELDNSLFIQNLQRRGFYVAEESYSNYTQTRISLASSLNMRYIDEVANYVGESESNPIPTYIMIQENIVEKTLSSLGYKMINFYSPMFFANFMEWDQFSKLKFLPNSFTQNLLNSTALSVFVNPLIYNWHRDSINYVFSTLPESSAINGPQFTFAHILCPHPPFVFNADGSERNDWRLFNTFDADHYMKFGGSQEEYKEGYSNQIEYLQQMIIGVFDTIRAESTDPFIFIIQGDHGPGMFFDHNAINKSDLKERMAILNAIYFFDGDYKELYPKISPVNTFRVIFNNYFGLSEPLLEDRHYFSKIGLPYDLDLVDQELEGQ